MKRRFILVLTVAIMTLAGSILAQQGPPPGGAPPAPPSGGPSGPPQGAPPLDLLSDFLKLTDEQKTAWQALGKQTAEANKPRFDEQRTLHESLKSMLESSSPDATAIGNAMIRIRAIGEAIRTSTEKLETDKTALLTSDQKLRLEAFKAAQQFLGRGPGMPPPPPGSGQVPAHGSGF